MPHGEASPSWLDAWRPGRKPSPPERTGGDQELSTVRAHRLTPGRPGIAGGFFVVFAPGLIPILS